MTFDTLIESGKPLQVAFGLAETEWWNRFSIVHT